MRSIARRILVAPVVAIGIVGACSATGLSTPGVSTASPPTATRSAQPAATPTQLVVSSEPATPSPASDAPVALLAIGADRHPGEVGGFTFGSYSQSAPWLPATALETVAIPAGATLRVELDRRATIASWTARLATAADMTADAVMGLAEGDGPSATFAPPPSGDWVLSVTITYGKGQGSGAYYWHLVVE